MKKYFASMLVVSAMAISGIGGCAESADTTTAPPAEKTEETTPPAEPAAEPATPPAEETK